MSAHMLPVVQTTKPAKQRHGNPESAKPMPGLSARAQKLLAHRRPGFCTPIEPAGQGLAREVMRRASI